MTCSKKYMLLVCVTVLSVCGMLYAEKITFPTENNIQELLTSQLSPPPNLTKKGTLKTLISQPKQRGVSWKDSETLIMLLLSIIKAELSQCILAILWDSALSGSSIVDSLSRLPNIKQVVGNGEIGNLLWWQAKECRAYFLLVNDPSSLMYHVEYAAQEKWDYSGRFVIVGLSRSQMDTLIITMKGRKTEHILGIVQDKPEHYVVLRNMLYKKDRLSRIITWPTPFPTNVKDSFQPSIALKTDHLQIKNLVTRDIMIQPNFTQRLFPDTMRNMQGSTLNVSIFVFPPEIMYRRDEEGNLLSRYGGNVRLVEIMAEIFNFTLRFIEIPEDELWGHQLPNGTWNGMVGLFARGEGDIGIANLFISDMGGRKKHQWYTAPYGQESTCILIKKGASIPQWQSLALPFKRETWIAVLVMAIVLGPIFFALSQPSVTRDEKLSGQSMAFINLYTFGVHLKVGQPHLPVRTSLQIFVGFLWVYVIIVLEAYSAKLVAFLTVERFPEGINTLEELYHSSLPVYGQTPWWVDSLTAAKNFYARKLVSQYSTLTDFEDIYKHLDSGKGVYIASSNNLIYTISLLSKNGNPTMRIMRECFQPYNMAMGVQSYSPLKKNLDQAVNWVVQAGLTTSWVRETLLIVRQERRGSINDSEDAALPEGDSGISFSLEHLQGVFIMFGAGCGLSLFIFASEFFLYRNP